MGWVGLEPTTNALKGHCSTIELPTRLEEMRTISFLPRDATPNHKKCPSLDCSGCRCFAAGVRVGRLDEYD